MTPFTTRARALILDLFDGHYFADFAAANALAQRATAKLREGAPVGSEAEFAVVMVRFTDLEWSTADYAIVSADGTSTDPDETIIIQFDTTITKEGFTLRLSDGQ